MSRPPGWRSLLTAAVRNNAAWCDLVCTALGVQGAFTSGLYVNRSRVPDYYPNVITLSQAVDEDVVLSSMDGVEHWSIKDSYGSLNLTSAGLTRLFEAQWLLGPPNPPMAGMAFRIVDGDEALRRWTSERGADDSEALELAWSQRADLAFVSIIEGEAVLGSGVLNEAHGVVGLSNVMSSIGDPGRCWAGLLAASQSVFPGLAVVGYETGEDLAVAQSVGCQPVGPLAVWAR